jgi:hypothetical protein
MLLDFGFFEAMSVHLEMYGLTCVYGALVLLLKQRLPDVPILRVNQIDAARLDVEMTAMLREQLNKVFSLAQVPFCESLSECYCG